MNNEIMRFEKTSLICILIVLCSSCAVLSDKILCNYESCNLGDERMLNVHLVPHTHDDVGWLKTVDQYFFGANKSIQAGAVQFVLDSVIQELHKDPAKKFIYVETAFFWRYWRQLHDMQQHAVKKLVNEGQLEFISGGWSMNDEAVTHYTAIIDNMSFGLRFLKTVFGDCGIPRVTWQIDPFGHSREQASLFAMMGFDGLFFGRMDYDDFNSRKATKTLEQVWKGSANLGESAYLFTGALFNGYNPPPGFCYDQFCADPPIMDDKKLHDYNVDERVDTFIKYATKQAESYATNHIIMTMGSDFQYENANEWYKNLDKLIAYVNARQANGSNVNIFYSTPSCYLYALNQAGRYWTTKSDDFFPYASGPHTYWTGYFTSRPNLKLFTRNTNNFLQVCKQLDALARLGPLDNDDLDMLKRAVGVAQHHDAITGTEKQHVAYDYAQRLSEGISECQDAVNDAYRNLMAKEGMDTPPPVQTFCPLLNISQCEVSERNNQFTVTVYNPLAWTVPHHVRIPVQQSSFAVTGPNGGKVESQVVPVSDVTKRIPGRSSNAENEVVFHVELPPLGFQTFFLKADAGLWKWLFPAARVDSHAHLGNDVEIKNEHVSLIFDGTTNLLTSITNLDSKVSIPVTQSFYWYRGATYDNDTQQASGAYIFRPNGTNPTSLGDSVTMSVIKGSIVQEVRQQFTPWLSQVIRLYKGHTWAEFEWTVGPIPVDDNMGKEIITRFDTKLATKGMYYTDANGREMLQRVRDFRPTWKLNVTEPVSGNYYPVTSRIFIKDAANKNQFTVLNDRAQGGGSIQDGSIELMVHRRLLEDDGKGVGEPLNETGPEGQGLVSRGKHYVIMDTVANSAKAHRELAQKVFLAPWMSFTDSSMTQQEWSANYKTNWSGLNFALPPNVHVLTLEQWRGSSVLLRLEHFYENNEDPVLSQPATVSLQRMFSPFEITAAEEMTLAANKVKSEATRLHWKTENDRNRTPKSPLMAAYANYLREVETGPLQVTLNPMEIRTFVLTLGEANQIMN